MGKRLTALFTAVCIALMMTGCVKSASYLDRIETLEKKTCACVDKTCAEQSFNEFLATAREYKKDDVRLNDADNMKLGTHTAAIIRCVMMKGVSPITIQEELLKFKMNKPLTK